MVNRRPNRPTRFCLNSTGPREVQPTRIPSVIISGAKKISAIAENTMSRLLFAGEMLHALAGTGLVELSPTGCRPDTGGCSPPDFGTCLVSDEKTLGDFRKCILVGSPVQRNLNKFSVFQCFTASVYRGRTATTLQADINRTLESADVHFSGVEFIGQQSTSVAGYRAFH